MTKLKIPKAEQLAEIYLNQGFVSKEDANKAAMETVRILGTKFDPDDHPICAALGEERFHEICNTSMEMALAGVPLEERLDQTTDLIDQSLREAAPLGSREAAKLDRDLLREADKGDLDLDNLNAVSQRVAKRLPWIEIIRRWIDVETNHYSSVRGGTSSGRIGRGFRRKWRKLRVVATTHGSNVTVKLFGIPALSRSVVSTFVVSTHYRGVFGILPDAASPLRAGAIRNGVTKVKTANSWIVSKAAVFIDNDPDLRNMTYFGNSSDAGISLSVSGTP